MNSSNIAVYDELAGREFSYQELDFHCSEMGKIIQPENKTLALLLTKNDYVSIVLYLSLVRNNYAVMLLESSTDKGLLDGIISRYTPDCIFCTDNLEFVDYKKQRIVISTIVYFLYSAKKKVYSDINNELAVLLSTSGSTGSSKFVKLTKRNLEQNALSIVSYLGIDCNQKAITTLPMQYSFGLSIINTHLISGAQLICTSKSVVQKEFWELFRNRGATTFSGVPYTYQILKNFRFHNLSIPTLEYFTQAGGHLNSKTKSYFLKYSQENQKKFVVMYGQTEATARISFVPFERLEEKIESIGVAIPGGKLVIKEGDVIINKPGVIGELVYYGPNVMLGYAESREDLGKEDELKGELKTGDLGKFDDQGFFYVVGRIKRFVKVFGNRLNLDDIERILEVEYKVPFAVTGLDDKIIIAYENELDEKKISEHLSRITKLHHSAFGYSLFEKLPVSPNGKKDYNIIKEKFNVN